jgi:hypothetical protein
MKNNKTLSHMGGCMSVGESFERNFIGGSNEGDVARENDLTRDGRQVLFDALTAFKINTINQRNRLVEKIRKDREGQLGEKALNNSRRPKHRTVRELPPALQRSRDERGALWTSPITPGVDLSRHHEPTAEEKTQRLLEKTLGLDNAGKSRMPAPLEAPQRGRSIGDELGRTRVRVRSIDEQRARERKEKDRERKI